MDFGTIVGSVVMIGAGMPILAHQQVEPRDKQEMSVTHHTAVAKVGETIITAGEVRAEINRLIPLTFYHARLPRKDLDEFRLAALRSLILRELKVQDARRRGLTASSDELWQTLEQTVEQLGDDWSKMPEAVKQQSLKEHRQRLERRVLLNKVEALAVASAEAVTEEDLLEEYEAHPQRYQDPEAAHLLHILIKVAPSASAEEARQSYEQATRARERIASGEPFTAVARELSEDIYREAGGDLGFVERGQFLQGQLDEAAFALQDGELSAVILSLQGYHILFRVESRTPRRHSIEEARDKILASLLRQRRSQAVHDWEGHLLNAGEVLLLAPWADPEDVLTAARPKPAGR